jgi:hypothetical protein
VNRPTFVSVDKRATPPTMTLCFEGDPQPSEVTTTLVLDGDDLRPLPDVLVHCPGCCAKIGNLQSPHVYQMKQCSVCKRGIEIRYEFMVLRVRLTVG